MASPDSDIVDFDCKFETIAAYAVSSPRTGWQRLIERRMIIKVNTIRMSIESRADGLVPKIILPALDGNFFQFGTRWGYCVRSVVITVWRPQVAKPMRRSQPSPWE
jgi:hypothetical protein